MPDGQPAGQARNPSTDEAMRRIQVRQMAFSLALQSSQTASRTVDELVKDATLIADFLLGDKE